MLIKEKKHSKEDLVYQTFCLQKSDYDFIILDDCTTEITKEVNEIFNLIKKFGYQLKVIDCRKYSIDIVKIIKALQGITYTEMANDLEISRSAFYNWLNGAYELTNTKAQILNDVVCDLIYIE